MKLLQSDCQYRRLALLTNSALWLRVGGVASALVAVSLVIGLLAGG